VLGWRVGCVALEVGLVMAGKTIVPQKDFVIEFRMTTAISLRKAKRDASRFEINEQISDQANDHRSTREVPM
jgi:hypothetical protein